MIRIQDIQLFLRSILRQVVQTGDTVVDGTAGNGNDTLFLSQLVGREGEVYAFDIQQNALNNTIKLLEQENAHKQVKLFRMDHALIDKVINTPIKAAMFNLGYLPGSDRSIITNPQSTLKAVLNSCALLQKDGIITITAYRGHPGGNEEAGYLIEALATLSKDFTVLSGQYLNLERKAPFWIMVQKK